MYDVIKVKPDYSKLAFKARTKGKIAEEKAAEILEKQGYKVTKLVEFRGKKEFRYKQVEELLENYKGNSKKLIKYLSVEPEGLPDFICLKKGEVYFYEIKSNNSGVRESQRKWFPKLCKRGYPISIFRIEVTEEETLVKMRMIENEFDRKMKIIQINSTNFGKLWDTIQTKKLIELYNSGTETIDIAIKLKRTPASIRGKLHRLGF